MNRMKISVYLFICLALVFIFSSCDNFSEPYDHKGFRVLSTKTYFQEAMSLAEKWEPSAYPTTQISVPFTLKNSRSDLYVTYTFRTKEDPKKWFIVSIFDTNPLETIENQGEYDDDKIKPFPPEIDFYSLPIDSLEAIEIAYNSGGNYVLRKYGEIDHLSMAFLETGDDSREFGELYWRVSFSPINERSVLYVYIDAITGEVVGEYRSDGL